MRKQYIKVPIPEAISEDGGASILFVNKQTVPLDGSVKEALAGNYCTGQATLIRNLRAPKRTPSASVHSAKSVRRRSASMSRSI